MRALITISLLFLCHATQVNAKIHYVPTDVRSIQTAIDTASVGDTVIVSPGNFQESLRIEKRLIIRGSTNEKNATSIITRSGITNRLIIFSGAGADGCELSHFSIENTSGGAIVCENASPLLTNLNLYKNSSSENGGAILCINASPVIQNTTLRENQSLNKGGAIAITGKSNPLIENCNFYENTSTAGGGAIACFDGAQFQLIDSQIDSNCACGEGGGIYVSGNATSVVKNTRFSKNSATRGGGIALRQGTLRLANNTITDNFATDCAGGIYCSESTMIFDSQDRSDLYFNSARIFKDIFTDVPLSIYLNSFTVLKPTSYYASILSKIQFYVKYGKIAQIEGELHVAANPAEAKDPEKFATIDEALARVYAAPLTPAIIHLPDKRIVVAPAKEGWPLFIPDYVTLQGAGSDKTILDGNNHNALIHLENIEGVKIRDLTLTKGFAENGGGIHFKNKFVSNDTSVVFSNLIITQNEAKGLGGGVYLSHANAKLENVRIEKNKAHDGGGMAINLGIPVFLREEGKKCCICNNTASQNGQDLYSPSTYVNVYLECFTLHVPTVKEIYPLENFTIIIEKPCSMSTDFNQIALEQTQSLFQSIYPNPLTSATTIEFSLPEDGRTEIRVFNILGQTTSIIFQGSLNKGWHRLKWTADYLESGIYFIQISNGHRQTTKRCVKIN